MKIFPTGAFALFLAVILLFTRLPVGRFNVDEVMHRALPEDGLSDNFRAVP
jgi:hypothetical protein